MPQSSFTLAVLAVLATRVALAQEPVDDEPVPQPAPVTPSPAPVVEVPSQQQLKLLEEQSVGFARTPAGKNIDASGPFLGMGTDRRALSGAEYYATVGRDDLARAYTSAARRRKLLMILGGVLAAVGLIAGEVISFLPWGTGSDGTIGLHLGGILITGAVSVAGDVMLLVGRFSDPAPVNAEAAAALADEHNRRVREKLGLPPDPNLPHAHRSDGGRWLLLPQIHATGVGLALARSF